MIDTLTVINSMILIDRSTGDNTFTFPLFMWNETQDKLKMIIHFVVDIDLVDEQICETTICNKSFSEEDMLASICKPHCYLKYVKIDENTFFLFCFVGERLTMIPKKERKTRRLNVMRFVSVLFFLLAWHLFYNRMLP